MMYLDLKILSPEGVLEDCKAESVRLPGTKGSFEVLRNHAPIISSLEKGEVVYVTKGGRKSLKISSGFVRVLSNTVSVCVEI